MDNGDPPSSKTAAAEQASAGEELFARLRVARRRIFVVRLLEAIALDLTLFGSLFALALFAGRLAGADPEPLLLLVSLLGASLALSLGRSLGRRPSLFDAARAVDERLGLKERAASAVFLEEEPGARIDPEWARLIHADSSRRLAAADLRRHFPIRLRRRAWLVLAPAAAALSVFLWAPALDIFGIQSRRQAEAALAREVERRKESLEEKLEEVLAEARRMGAAKLEELLEGLRREPAGGEKPREERSGDRSSNDARKDALLELTRREDQLRKAGAGSEQEAARKAFDELQKAALRDFEVTRKLREALKEGDFQKARAELENLGRELEGLPKKSREELTAEERERLAKLASELERLSKDAGSLSKLSSALSGAAGSLTQGELAEALASLELSAEELDDLARIAGELDLLDEALEIVRLSKEELSRLAVCPECGTPYCADCGKPQCSCKPSQKPGGT